MLGKKKKTRIFSTDMWNDDHLCMLPLLSFPAYDGSAHKVNDIMLFTRLSTLHNIIAQSSMYHINYHVNPRHFYLMYYRTV